MSKKMRKGSPEAKAWGKKMQRLRKNGATKPRKKSSTKNRVGYAPRKGKGASRYKSPYKVIPDAVELAGIGLGAKEIVSGNVVQGAAVAIAGGLIGKGLKYIGRKSKLVRKVNKAHKIMGQRVRLL